MRVKISQQDRNFIAFRDGFREPLRFGADTGAPPLHFSTKVMCCFPDRRLARHSLKRLYFKFETIVLYWHQERGGARHEQISESLGLTLEEIKQIDFEG